MRRGRTRRGARSDARRGLASEKVLRVARVSPISCVTKGDTSRVLFQALSHEADLPDNLRYTSSGLLVSHLCGYMRVDMRVDENIAGDGSNQERRVFDCCVTRLATRRLTCPRRSDASRTSPPRDEAGGPQQTSIAAERPYRARVKTDSRGEGGRGRARALELSRGREASWLGNYPNCQSSRRDRTFDRGGRLLRATSLERGARAPPRTATRVSHDRPDVRGRERA